jgi:tungstate transport system ATP-binding protein
MNAATGDNIYSLRNVTHSYGVHPTLAIDALDIRRGAVVELKGPNGSGKSTLLKLLAFLEPFVGELLFDGCEARGREIELRREATLLLQEPYLLRRSVYENVAYGLKLRKLPRVEIDERVAGSLSRVGLEPDRFARRPWYRLSGGEAQRVALAARLALRPRVLLLDEPTSSVDETSAALIREAVCLSVRDTGTTVVIATHDPDWMQGVQATQVVTLRGGRVVKS